MSSPDRRDFLKKGGILAMGLTMTPQQALASALLKALFRSSTAEAAGVLSPRYYVNVYIDNGPARYTFDHWLRSNADDPALVFNPGTGTAFTYNTSRQVTGTEYRTFDYNGIQVPQLFATLSSAERSAFLDSFLVIRGYGSGMDGHELNAAMQMHPLASAPSLSGLLADHASRYFRAVQFRNRGLNSRFNSNESVTMNKLTNPTQPLKELLQAIVPTSDKARLVRGANRELFSTVRAYLNALPDDRKSVKIARQNVETTYELFSSQLGDFSAVWTALVADYLTAIESGMRKTGLPGINATLDGSQPITGVSDGTRQNFGLGISVGSGFTLASGKNLLDVGKNMSTTALAEGLALAEYCIANGLIGSLELTASPAEQLLIDPAGSPTNTANWFTMDGDMHQTQSYGMVYVTSLYYRGMISGLLLLRDRLVAAGKWNQTVIQMFSEFNRTLGGPGSGSGHGYNQMVSSIFSGVLRGGPYVVGNVSTKPPRSYIGSQGLAAPIAGYPVTGMPGPMTMASTLSALMAVPDNPWKSFAPPLVALRNDGTLEYLYGKGKLVSG